jgi:hypothetical protein
VPSGRKMAERVVAAGYTAVRPIVDGTNFVKDPDGYSSSSIRGPQHGRLNRTGRAAAQQLYNLCHPDIGRASLCSFPSRY